jgi:hypothetical protein
LENLEEIDLGRAIIRRKLRGEGDAGDEWGFCKTYFGFTLITFTKQDPSTLRLN